MIRIRVFSSLIRLSYETFDTSMKIVFHFPEKVISLIQNSGGAFGKLTTQYIIAMLLFFIFLAIVT